LVFLGVASSAEARLSCSFSGAPQNVLTVRASGIDTRARIRRSGDGIEVRQFLGRSRICSGGNPTVVNTDSIRVVLRKDASVELQLGGGAFAPGATPESEGESEIEVEFSGFVVGPSVVGTPADEEFQWGPGGSHPGLNLNPRSADDRDIDVTLKGRYSFMIADAAGGNDKIIPAPGFESHTSGLFSKGGKGNDLLIAPPNTGGVLEGGPGDDTITGSRLRDYLIGGDGDDHLTAGAGDDLITGGHDADVIFGGPGPDRINAKHSDRDTVRCGPGRDHVRMDPRDRLRGCEQIRRR
jgi:Ca2+-binding RTX toxin-like protein